MSSAEILTQHAKFNDMSSYEIAQNIRTQLFKASLA